ncbi:MAG: PLP-dependent aminotransferase family protein [Roseibium sp.]|uniref:MocR-like ectoine utilization transcription factor EhuR n=1 Tax=Roseibium sp. TaxID=1936156 RepID=UPI0026336762|nr:PLP-dependent aminotransferase family protein [Roseibium sp.]MCV0424239.1 PLP-dependent aminotransferase family protein [Roseibium sp.]
MTIWPPRPEDLKRPAYRSLAEAVIRAVEAGDLRNGDRLPTHRDLAYDLNISVQTVSRAYDELIRRGFIAGEVGRGTFVRLERNDTKTPFLPDRQQGELIDCSMLKPVFETLHSEAMCEALAALSVDMPQSVISSFRPLGALRRYSEPSFAWLELCGLRPHAQSLLLTNGNTSAMTVALMTVANPGDLILTEELGHHTLKPLTRYLGLRLRGLTIDEEGIVPASFVRECEKESVKALYLMPTGLNPTATLMSETRRAEIVEIARAKDVLIIENDAWGPLQPERPVPIAAIAPERTFYFTSLTKCIMAGLRFGFLVVPEAYEAAASNRHLVTNWMVTALMAEIGTRWITDGTAQRLCGWQSVALAERNRLARKILAGIPFHGTETGMHIWLPLPAPWTEEGFVAHATRKGVAVGPGSTFMTSDINPMVGVRICLGGVNVSELETGLTIISRLIRSQPEPALLS